MTHSENARLDATSFGEGQLRLNVELGHTLRQADSLSVSVAGAEGNVMGLLSRLGNTTGLVTALPANPVGRKVADEYRAAGIETDAIIWRASGRVALYFVEPSSPPVPSSVTYDRQGSCFWDLTDDDVDWGYLSSSRLVHLTGITACLNETLYAIVLKAAQAAQEVGQAVSVDVNYRAHLVSPEEARRRLVPLLELSDVISCSKRDASTVFGIAGDTVRVAQTISETYNGATTLVSDGAYPAVVYSNGESFSVPPPVTQVIDRVGAGDALIAGFLHGYLHGDVKRGLELGVAAAAVALTRFGDQVHTSLDELQSLIPAFGADIVR
jgi:2-dehydro-3-deoxygluconokinase